MTWWGALLAASLIAIAIAGDFILPAWLGLDLDCQEGGRSSRSRALEMVLCSLGAGPKGWLFLAWLAWPPMLFAHWLCRRLRAAATPTAAEPRNHPP